MQPSRRQFLTGAMALGATKALAQDEPEKLPHTLDFAEEQKKWEDLLETERATWERNRDEERVNEKLEWEDQRRDSLERYKACTELERIMLTKFLTPIDDWLDRSLFMKEPEIKRENNNPFDDPVFVENAGTIWLLLKVTSAEPLIGSPFWVKLSLSRHDLGQVLDDVNDEAGNTKKLRPETLVEMFWRKRDGLLEVLEHHLVMILNDPELPEDDIKAYKKTMVDGTAHLYRLIDENSDPEKVTKAQMLA